MNGDSPFANLPPGNYPPPAIPIIGQPTIIGAVVAVTMACICDTHSPIVGIVGGVFTCPTCKLQWGVGAEAKFAIQRVTAPQNA